VAGIEICLYQRRPWRFSHKALRANTLSVFQGEVDHPITSYLNFTFPTEFALVSFHYVSLTVTSESLSMPQYLQVREFCGNGVDYQMSDYATNQDLGARPDDRFRVADEVPGTDIRQLLDRSYRSLLFLVSACVATPVAHFISFKICHFINTLRRLGFLADLWRWALIAVIRMKAVIYVTPEIVRAVKPRASANEYTAGEPLRAVVAVGRAAIWCGVIVTIGTVRGDADDTDLSRCFGSGDREANSSQSD
jgi:hypothetical protein